MSKISIPRMSGGSIMVEATIIGQWAVHQSVEYFDYWTLTDAESGYGLGHFSAEHVAVNLARRLHHDYDVRGYAAHAFAKKEPTEDERRFIADIKRIIQHETFKPLRLDVEIGRYAAR